MTFWAGLHLQVPCGWAALFIVLCKDALPALPEMSDFGKGWPLCLQPLPLTSSFRNVLTQNRSSSCSALVLSRCGLSPRLAFLSSSPSVHFEALAPGFPPQLPCWGHSSPSLWKRHLLWLWGHCPLLVCFCLVSYLLSSTSSSFSAHVSVLQGTTSFSFPPLSPWAISRPWPILALMFTTCCTGNLSVRPSTQTPHLLDISAWRFHRSQRTCFRFLPVIALSFSSISGNDLTASLLAQTRNLGVILRDLFVLALLIGAVKSLFLLILCCSSPHTIPILLPWWGPQHLCSCGLLCLVFLFSNLISCQCFPFRVIFLTCKSNHVITLLKILQWLLPARRSREVHDKVVLACEDSQVWQHSPPPSPQSAHLILLPASLQLALLQLWWRTPGPQTSWTVWYLRAFDNEASSFA